MQTLLVPYLYTLDSPEFTVAERTVSEHTTVSRPPALGPASLSFSAECLLPHRGGVLSLAQVQLGTVSELTAHGQPSGIGGQGTVDKCFCLPFPEVYSVGFLRGTWQVPGAHKHMLNQLSHLPYLTPPAPSLPRCGITSQINSLHPHLVL